MTISSLRSVITGDFINKSAKVGTTVDSGKEIAQSISSGGSSKDLSTTLRTGARNFALGVQALNVGISYLQVSKDIQQKLVQLTDELSTVIKDAKNGSQPTSALLDAYSRISKKFEAGIRGAKFEDKNVLDVEQLSIQLKNAGLDPEKTDELTAIFKKLTSIGDSENTSVTQKSGELPEEELFQKSLNRAKIALEDETGDAPSRSTFFKEIETELADLKEKISQNVKSLDAGLEFVGKNINLVRAAGLAFLDASNQIEGTEEADLVANNIRDAVRREARKDVTEAHYLPKILEAGVKLLQLKS